jgi:transposase
VIRAGRRIFLATAAVDGRKGFDTLCQVVRLALGHDPLSGDLFVFRNRSAQRIKIIFWDDNGLVIYAKRLERGGFRWPEGNEGSITLSSVQLMQLLAGLPMQPNAQHDAHRQ